MAVAFLKFFISHELESTMWHTKQSGDVTLVNKRHVDHDDIPSRLNIFYWASFVICNSLDGAISFLHIYLLDDDLSTG